MATRRDSKPHEDSYEHTAGSLLNLSAVLSNQSHLFSCGGVIPLRDARPPVRDSYNEVTIRWDAAEPAVDEASTSCKIRLPLQAGREGDLRRLVEQPNNPAFSPDGIIIDYHPNHRNVLQMDPDDFCSTFDPYSVSILDNIAQVLLPTAVEFATHRAVHAELHKLHVCSGPSGSSRTYGLHVGRLQSPFHFGSLVVCLPVEHAGGQLIVRYKNARMTFDWSNSRQDASHGNIHWAALYTDCGHEVLEVTSGHRVRLTYNLHAVQGVHRVAGVSRTLNSLGFPLYHVVRDVVYPDLFRGEGGTLGFWCSHAYAYNNVAETMLLEMLKGVDAVLWETFKALGFHPHVAPVIRMDPELCEESRCRYGEDAPSQFIIGEFGNIALVNREMACIDDYRDMLLRWGRHSRKPVYWVTQPGAMELQIVYTGHRNRAVLDTIYSSCAILVAIPARTL